MSKFYVGLETTSTLTVGSTATFSGANTYNKIQSYYSGSYISGWKFSDYNGGIWYDAGSDDLTLNAGHANSQMLLNSGGAIALTLDASQNATFAGDVTIGSTNLVKLIDQSYGGQIQLLYGSDTWLQYHYTDNTLRFNYNGAGGDELTITTSGNATFAGTITSGAIYAPIYYDSDDTNYYINAGGTSQLTHIWMAGNITNVGNVTATGQVKSLTGWFTDNVYMSGGQLYLGASGSSTDDSYRLAASGGIFTIASRESGTWTTRMDIDTSGDATFAGTIDATTATFSTAINTPSAFNFTANTAQIKVGTSWNTGVLQFLNGATTAIEFDIPNGRIKNNLGKYLTSSGGNLNYFGSLDNYSMSLVTNNVPRLTIDNAGDTTFTGNVLVGGGTLTNPQSWGEILQVQNTGSNGAGVSIKDSNNEYNLATYSGSFYISDGTDERLTITSSGDATFAGGISADWLSLSNFATISGDLNLQADITVLNKAQSGYIDIATRDTSGSEVVYNLSNIGSATFAGSIKMGTDTATAAAGNVGTLRYRTSGNNSYVDMCMQTGASTYEWINIVQNNW